ncbi:MAG: hypothetical protein ABFD08_18690 [Syntrophomonas sp.]
MNFRCIGKYPKPINGLFNNHTINLLEQFNNQNFEVYFVVNSGGYKKENINKVNAVFIDLDAGRDENKDYYPLDVVQEYKQKKMHQIGQFPLVPSYIVETRNGYHVYWLLNDGAKIKQFEECENRLIDYFKSDTATKKSNMLLRVPGFYWCKDPNNKYFCRIIERNDVRYNIDDIIEKLPKNEDSFKRAYNKNNKEDYNIYYRHTQTENHLQLIKTKNMNALQEIIKPESVKFTCHDEVYEYLKKQDLALFLGLPYKFRCIFHNDKIPSANIYIDRKTGYYWYKCFSESCGVTKDIINIAESLLHCNTVKALRFLRALYKIEYQETEWQKEQKAILDENKRLLRDDERFELIAPETYKRIRNYIPQLILLNDFAKEHVVTENFTDDQDNALFFAGLTYLANLFKKKNDTKRVGNIIALFAYLGLLNKLNQEQIPEFLLKEAKHQAALKRQKYLVSYYSIPSYCDEIISFSENKSKEFKEHHLTMRGLTKEMFMRALGEEEANRIYPQMKGKVIPELNEVVTKKLEDALVNLIKEKGWTTEQEILDNVPLYFKGQNRFKKDQIKRVVGSLLDNYDLKKARLNKELREKLGIEDNSARFAVIYKDW